MIVLHVACDLVGKLNRIANRPPVPGHVAGSVEDVPPPFISQSDFRPNRSTVSQITAIACSTRLHTLIQGDCAAFGGGAIGGEDGARRDEIAGQPMAPMPWSVRGGRRMTLLTV
jgi:hypothetical protein